MAHVIDIRNQEEARRCLEGVGSSPAGIEYMVSKAVFRCLLIKDIQSRAANLLKQEMLAKGGEAAVSKNAAIGEGNSDVLLMGTLKQYRLLTEKLKLQPFGLKKVAEEIEAVLNALENLEITMELANGKRLAFGQRTLIMGILNITPDSFSDGGRYLDPEAAVKHALEMREAGADMIDLGAASSRPDSQMASAQEELQRLLPVIKRLVREDLILSVDTFRSEVARQMLEEGAHLINDIGGLRLDPDMIDVLVKQQAPAVIMHNRLQMNQGQPYQDLIVDILHELGSSMEIAAVAGLPQEKLIIDPGIGFGKTPAENRLIIKRLQAFKGLGRPVLLGASRKRFIGATLDLEVEERLEGSLAAVAMGIMNGADIIRVHDVKESKRVAMMTDAVRHENG